MRAYQDDQDEQTIINADDDGEMETIYVYMSREKPGAAVEQPEQTEPGQWPIIQHWVMGALAVLMLSAFTLVPDSPVYITRTISVAAIPLPIVEISASVPIAETGVQTTPARQASGELTIYNGLSVIQQLPAGFVVTSRSGIEIETDQAVTIPAGNAPTYGSITVAAHAVAAGAAGNIEAGAVDQADGSSLVVKNLSGFSGGQDARTVRYVTSADVNNAATVARAQLAGRQPVGLLPRPCMESQSQQNHALTVVWRCQYVTYHAPAGVRVLAVRLMGDRVVLQIEVAKIPR